VAGVRGAHHAVTRDEAIALHTVEAARLLNQSETRGSLALGHLADYTVWPALQQRAANVALDRGAARQRLRRCSVRVRKTRRPLWHLCY
jgi:imidazolonepropionase-like amidohydrolase